MKGDDIADRLLNVAVEVTALVKCLPEDAAGRHVTNQILRSATSPGANYDEARGAESPADFVHKLKVAEKEMRETHYWLRLIARAQWLPMNRVSPLISEANQLVAILHASARTARRNRGKH